MGEERGTQGRKDTVRGTGERGSSEGATGRGGHQEKGGMRGDEGTRNGGFQEGRMPGSGGTGESVSSLELGTENQVEERNPSPKSQPTLWISLPTQAPLGPLYLLEEFHGVSGGEGRWWRGAGTAVVMAGPRDAVHRAPRVVVAFQGVAVGHEGAPVTP